MKFCNMLSKLISTQNDRLFEEIIDYDHIRRLFKMALDSESSVHILLEGPPVVYYILLVMFIEIVVSLQILIT
ncbi:MAG: hypothetical protein JO327_09420 [Nitrososphaeraceae archaeon]|nr:hypothetical protein [Nitrososphaeraceae archaeon]MBV9668335.1 hypothetical protein [Nitrososphaeraceae archaeon]